VFWKRISIVLLLAMVATIGAAGCRTTAQGGEMVIRYNLGTEPQTLDSALATGQPELTLLNELFEGLVRLDELYQPQPGVAKSWDISDDGTVYTFHLRKAKWSNGDSLTAKDFKYGWLRAISPETSADYAYMLWYIKGAQAYTEGTGTADAVGIEVVNNTTIKITLDQATAYFLSICAFPTMLPVHQATVEASGIKYGSEVENIVTNGPFILTTWEHENILELVPYDDYWNRKVVKLDKLEVYCIEEESTELAMFEAGELDVLDNPPIEEMARLKEEGLVIGGNLGTYYYLYNCQKAPFDNPLVRKALNLAINRQQIVDNVSQGGQIPALAFVPPGIKNPVNGQDFRLEGGNYFADNDIATAQQLLAEAGYPNGQGLPKIEILTNDREAHIKIAQAIMEMWKQGLGIDNVTVRTEEWGVYLDSRDARNFQVARAGWIADYIDPMTFIDMWVTGGGNNNSFWGDPDYDALVVTGRTNTDQATRFQAMHDAEDIFMDVMPIAPIYFYTDPYMYKPYVKGVIKMPAGPAIDFIKAYIENP